MTSFTQHGENRVLRSVTLVIPCAGVLWLLALRGGMGASTYGILALLAVATALIGLNTWKNGQATGSMGQLIHEANLAPVNAPGALPAPEPSSSTRWDAWQKRGAALDAAGRARALLALSVVGTGALLWLA